MKKLSWFSFLTLLLAISVLLAATGCSAIFKGIGRKIGEEVSKQATSITEDDEENEETTEEEATKPAQTTKAGVTTAEQTEEVTDSGIEWPQDKMGDLPPIDASIAGVMNGEFGSIVNFAGVTKDQAKNYIKKLKDMGYETLVEATDADLLTYSGSKKNGDKTAVCMFTYDIDEQTAMITYTPQ